MEGMFAVLGLEPSLSIQAEEIEAAWRIRSSVAHPDAAEVSETADVALVNKARDLLLTPAGLLEVWLKARGIEATRNLPISSDLMDLFSQVGDALTSADAVIDKLQQAQTALAKSLLTAPAITAQKDIQNVMQLINQSIADRVEGFARFEDQLIEADALTSLNELKFLTKWNQQCQQRLLELIAI